MVTRSKVNIAAILRSPNSGPVVVSRVTTGQKEAVKNYNKIFLHICSDMVQMCNSSPITITSADHEVSKEKVQRCAEINAEVLFHGTVYTGCTTNPGPSAHTKQLSI